MAFWFGRKSAPEQPPFVPAWLAGGAESGGFVRGYEAQVEEVFRRNPVGLRAVRLVAGLTGSLPLFAEEGDPRAALLLKAGGLLERIAAGLLLHGNAYVRLATDSNDRPAVLYPMRPEPMCSILQRLFMLSHPTLACGSRWPLNWPAAADQPGPSP